MPRRKTSRRKRSNRNRFRVGETPSDPIALISPAFENPTTFYDFPVELVQQAINFDMARLKDIDRRTKILKDENDNLGFPATDELIHHIEFGLNKIREGLAYKAVRNASIKINNDIYIEYFTVLLSLQLDQIYPILDFAEYMQEQWTPVEQLLNGISINEGWKIILDPPVPKTSPINLPQ